MYFLDKRQAGILPYFCNAASKEGRMVRAIRFAKGLGIVGIAAAVVVLPAEWASGGLLRDLNL
jgi:hypothetical protein